MPYASRAQERWGNSPAGEKALGKAGVAEWNESSKGLKLPEKVKPKASFKQRVAKAFPKPGNI